MSNVLRLNILSLVTCLSTSFAFAAVPVSVNVVGHLDGVSRSTGTASPASGTSLYMAFRLYAEPGSDKTRIRAANNKNAALWGRQATIALENGDFDVDLSDSLGTAIEGLPYATLSDAVDAALARGSSTLYLGLTPESDSNAEIFPRLKLTAVPKAVLAANVRTLSKDFSATGGVLRAERLVVDEAATLTGSATYSHVDLGPGATVEFSGGLAVTGALTADGVRTTEARPNRVETDALASGTASLSVTGTLALAGTPVWNGALGTSQAGMTVSVAVVSAKLVNVTPGAVSARVLATRDFVNGGAQGFDSSADSDWNILADAFTTVDVLTLQGRESVDFLAWDERTASKTRRTSVTGGSWEAPCDCIAYFQTYLQCDASQYGACVQFYVGDGAKTADYTSLSPNAAASLGNYNGAVLKQSVPIVLRRGQVVRWLGYNPDKALGSTDLCETTHSQVDVIRYRAFQWR